MANDNQCAPVSSTEEGERRWLSWNIFRMIASMRLVPTFLTPLLGFGNSISEQYLGYRIFSDNVNPAIPSSSDTNASATGIDGRGVSSPGPVIANLRVGKFRRLLRQCI